jgi:two-component system, sensor histidine kinase LadS
MKRWVLHGLLAFLFLSSVNGSPVVVDVYQLEDEHKALDFEQVLNSKHFVKINDISALNFGISKSNFWLKISVSNTVSDATYKLALSTITPDTIEIYSIKDGRIEKKLIGEAMPSDERFLNYYFKPTAETPSVFYLKITGDGQPIALPFRILRSDIGDDKDTVAILFSGLIYGFVSFILIINLILFVGTKEKLYVYFFIFNVFCTGVVLYFDGFVKFLLIRDSVYWNNQFIILALCGSFVSVNYYFLNFLNIKKNRPFMVKYFHGINIAFLVVLCLSFWHPVGFNLYIKFNLVMTTAEAFLLFVSVVMVRHREQEYFLIQLISIVLLIGFGTVTQLYFFGFLPINLLTTNAIHCMVLPQIFIQAFALGKRFSVLAQERLALQSTLLESSEQYSQSLISTLENERKRLSSEFHDSIGQNLLVIRNRILLMLKQNYTAAQKGKLDGLASLTSETLEEIRIISQNLRPTTLDTIGLTASLNNMVERLKRSTEIKIDFNCPQNIDESVQKSLEINVYRILQELTNNVLKHSKATNCIITITQDEHCILMNITDDGVGFDTSKMASLNTGNGFSSIKERVKILKGELKIVSENQKGTTVNIKFPLKQ